MPGCCWAQHTAWCVALVVCDAGTTPRVKEGHALADIVFGVLHRLGCLDAQVVM